MSFRKDSFIASFGTSNGFNREEYLSWLSGQIQRFPEGFVMAYHMQQPIGQLELSIKTYQHKEIGYVHLYYIIRKKEAGGMAQSWMPMHRISFERTVLRNTISEFRQAIKEPSHFTKSKICRRSVSSQTGR